MSNSKTSRIQSNLLQQNCFVRDVLRANDLSSPDLDLDENSSFFETLDEVSVPDGIKLQRSSEKYPITPQYVNSFVDTSDYHMDPLGSVSSSPRGVNLGDISVLQSLLAKDESSLRSLYSELSKRFSVSTTPVVPAAGAAAVSPATSDNKEVK